MPTQAKMKKRKSQSLVVAGQNKKRKKVDAQIERIGGKNAFPPKQTKGQREIGQRPAKTKIRQGKVKTKVRIEEKETKESDEDDSDDDKEGITRREVVAKPDGGKRKAERDDSDYDSDMGDIGDDSSGSSEDDSASDKEIIDGKGKQTLKESKQRTEGSKHTKENKEVESEDSDEDESDDEDVPKHRTDSKSGAELKKKKDSAEESSEDEEEDESSDDEGDDEEEGNEVNRTKGNIDGGENIRVDGAKGQESKGSNEISNKPGDAQGQEDGETGETEETDKIALTEAQKATNAILTDKTFASLEGSVCEDTLKGLKDMGFSYMTEIQAKTIPHLLEGRDLLAAAKTGSGKTLAFLIPAIELIHKLKFMPRNGTGVLIISPTRELCMQIYGVLKEVMEHHYHTFGIVMGGTHRGTEAKKLAKGINILVATPGRLLDHMKKTPEFMFKNLQCLVIDEADRILQIGFEEDMKQIVKMLPKRRQTMLFSATQTRKTEDLARISLKKEPVYIGVDDEKTVATVNGLEQGYVLCPSEKRFLLLFTFLKKNRNKKVMVFMSSCMSVKFHAELLNYIDLPVVSIHGRKKQQHRTATFFQFCQAKQGILLCTDVAARGLDIPAVDWIVQFDPPDDPKEYIHRVGRTARGLHGKGHALLILRPEEVGFLRYLKHAKVPINEYDFSWGKIANIQIQLEKLLEKNYFLHMSSREAYKGYIRAYDSHSLKQIFNVQSLDLNMVAKSFGFRVPPSVDLIVPASKRANKQNKGFNLKQHKFKKAQKAKVFRHVETKKDRRDMKRATNT